ncbi:hypothetical protein ABZU32_17610 [Sphaerisporangium sp. NPDC005288]|uniref:hypothetical protein n=1 Tax=Sphaerisporangium sp. NPDC005288 TaxID=3155114 RepID=UPI0033AE8A00
MWQLRHHHPVRQPAYCNLRLQAVWPATVTNLYRDLMAGSGKSGWALSSRTIDYIHVVLRVAFHDAVTVD